ncbi:MAG: 2-hydroxyacid dehydrogenase [Burkholderiales bacterium]
MILLIKETDNDGRLARIPEFLTTDWQIEVADERERERFAEAMARAHACVSMQWTSDMPAAPRLQLLQLPGAGLDAIDFDAVPGTATVCNVFEHEIGIAEYVMASMLQWVIPLDKLQADLRHGRWHGSHLLGPVHGELFGKTLGIVGYGHIGREAAQRARAFGMNVLACGRSARAGDASVATVQAIDQLDSLLAQSDFVLISLPLTDDTHGIIGASEFAAMKPTGVIINVARGALIDEEALYVACRDRKIGGAIIDTWYQYPSAGTTTSEPSRFAFRDLDNIIMTPHASAWTDSLITRRNRVIASNLDRLATNQPLLNVVRGAIAQTLAG